MEARSLGRQGPALSVIGFGAWAIGGGGYAWGWGEQDDAVSVAAIRRALELGVNWIDTAPSYGLGRSEEIVGRAVQGLAERPFIATKCGQVWDSLGRIRTNLRPGAIPPPGGASPPRLRGGGVGLYAARPPRPLGEQTWAWGGRGRASPPRRSKTPGQLAIGWVLRRHEVTSAIVGVRRPEQAGEDVGGAGWQLSDEGLQEIDRALA